MSSTAGNGSHQQGFGLWETVEGLRSEFERRIGSRMGPRMGMGPGMGMGPRMGMRMGRGDVRAAILSLLVDGPMHGYQIIQEIEKRSNGAWKPSPGSVYPTLQLLADEGVIVAKEASGRKTYSLTDAGKEEASASGPAPWEATTSSASGARSSALPKAGVKLAQAIGQVARGGSAKQVEDAIAIIDETRRKLYAILSED